MSGGTTGASLWIEKGIFRSCVERRGLIREARHRPPETWWDTHTATPTHKGRMLARALYDLADIAD